MGLTECKGEHRVVECSGPCSVRAKEDVCCKRLFGVQAGDYAAQVLQRRGWHVDGRGTPKERWYCSSCRGRNL